MYRTDKKLVKMASSTLQVPNYTVSNAEEELNQSFHVIESELDVLDDGEEAQDLPNDETSVNAII